SPPVIRVGASGREAQPDERVNPGTIGLRAPAHLIAGQQERVTQPLKMTIDVMGCQTTDILGSLNVAIRYGKHQREPRAHLVTGRRLRRTDERALVLGVRAGSIARNRILVVFVESREVQGKDPRLGERSTFAAI